MTSEDFKKFKKLIKELPTAWPEWEAFFANMDVNLAGRKEKADFYIRFMNEYNAGEYEPTAYTTVYDDLFAQDFRKIVDIMEKHVNDYRQKNGIVINDEAADNADISEVGSFISLMHNALDKGARTSSNSPEYTAMLEKLGRVRDYLSSPGRKEEDLKDQEYKSLLEELKVAADNYLTHKVINGTKENATRKVNIAFALKQFVDNGTMPDPIALRVENIRSAKVRAYSALANYARKVVTNEVDVNKEAENYENRAKRNFNQNFDKGDLDQFIDARKRDFKNLQYNKIVNSLTDSFSKRYPGINKEEIKNAIMDGPVLRSMLEGVADAKADAHSTLYAMAKNDAPMLMAAYQNEVLGLDVSGQKDALHKELAKDKNDIIAEANKRTAEVVKPKVLNLKTIGAFQKYVDRLEAGKTGHDSDDYEDIIKYLKSINTEAREYDNSINGYGAKLIKTREYIDKYIGHKAEKGVKQNAYKKLAAVEELSQEIDRRVEELYDYAEKHNKQELMSALSAVRDTERIDRVKNDMSGYTLDEKRAAAKVKGVKQEDIDDLKLVDQCMETIIDRAEKELDKKMEDGWDDDSEDEDEKTIEELETMREQFRDNPSKAVVRVANININNKLYRTLDKYSGRLIAVGYASASKPDELIQLTNYVKSINYLKGEPGDFYNTLEGYAVQLITTRELIDKYIGYKAKNGVKQSDYKELAAVEELSQEIDDRIEDLIPDAEQHNKQQLKKVLSDRRIKSMVGYVSQVVRSTDEEELDRLCSVAKDKGYKQEDIDDLKFVDRCMQAIAQRANVDDRQSILDMRWQFQDNPSNSLIEAPGANVEVKDDKQPQKSSAQLHM